MELIGFVIAIGVGSLLGVVHLLRSRQGVVHVAPATIRTAHPAVRFPRDEAELRAALSRAARAERGIAASVTARADRYEASMVPTRTDGRPHGAISRSTGTRSF